MEGGIGREGCGLGQDGCGLGWVEGGIGWEGCDLGWEGCGLGWEGCGLGWEGVAQGCAKSSCPLYSLVISSSPLAQHWVCTTAEDRTLNVHVYVCRLEGEDYLGLLKMMMMMMEHYYSSCDITLTVTIMVYLG